MNPFERNTLKMKKLTLMTSLAVLGLASTAFAADPIKLSCPAGSVQKMLVQQNLACEGGNGRVVAGPMVMVYPSGAKMAEGSVDAKGSRTGAWTLFSEKGVKTHVIEFSNGNFDGKWVEFHATGQQKTVRLFKAGLNTGSVQEFDTQGKLVASK